MPKPTERRTPVELTVSSPSESDEETPLPRQPFMPWLIAALIGSASAVLLGWLVVGVVVSVGWMTSPSLAPATILNAISQAWLGMHGVAFRLAGLTISVPPLGLAAVVVVAMGAVAGYATGQLDESQDRFPLRSVLKVAGACTGAYSVVALLLASVVGAPSQAAGCVVGALVLSGVGSLAGALRASHADPGAFLPAWTRPLTRAILAGLGVLVLAAASVLAVAVASHRPQIDALQAGLAPDAVGAVLLVVLDVAYLPNLVLWATSWVLGAGITLGDGSLLSMSVTDVGFLPAIPVFGVVGEPGTGGGPLFWWLVVGVVAGLVAALVVGLARPRARFDETALVGGLSGVAAGLLVTLLCSLAGGGLGGARLSHIGALVNQLVIVAPTLLGLSGLVGGAVLGLVRRPPRAVPVAATPEEATSEVPDP